MLGFRARSWELEIFADRERALESAGLRW